MVAAYEILGDPEKRKAYDLKCGRAGNIQQTKQATEKRETEATERRREKAAEYSPKEDKERLTRLDGHRRSYEEKINEAKQKLEQSRESLKKLQKQDDEAIQQAARYDGWWSSLSSYFLGKPQDQEEQKKRQETERLRRVAHRRVVENSAKQEEARLQSFKDGRKDVEEKMGAIKKKMEAEARAQRMKEEEQLRKKEEANKRAEEERTRQRWAEWTESQEAARRAGEAARRKARAEAQARAKAQEEAEAARMARERQERFRSSWASPNVGSTTSSYRTNCRHGKFWPRIAGSHLCENCQTTQRHFAFQCPGCQKIACANCRQILRDQAWGN